MTETTETSAPAAPKKSSGGLGGKVLAELQEIAGGLGIEGAAAMRKGALIDAIKTARGDAPTAPRAAKTDQADKAPVKADKADKAVKAVKGDKAVKAEAATPSEQTKQAGAAADAPADKPAEKPSRGRRGSKREQGAQTTQATETPQTTEATQAAQVEALAETQAAPTADVADSSEAGKAVVEKTSSTSSNGNGSGNRGGRGNQRNQPKADTTDATTGDDRSEGNRGGRNQNRQQDQNRQKSTEQNQPNQNQPHQNRQQGGGQQGADDDEDGNGRRRNRRGRNRNTRGMESDPTYSEDDVLVPAAGILDILDNYAFVRTTGYLPSENDVYVSLSMVRKWGLRRGDAVTGQVRQPREGERTEKFNPMVKVETVNGMTLEESAKRVEFTKLTPVHPSERLRLEGAAGGLTGRVIDLVAPVGKGQRGLIVSPPQAGKTMIMQQIANAITENNPECHLMIVLVDERPEEVTDFQRTVKGEVIASTFDRPATDHTMVAELAIERAKRLVELGHDVVLLLDGLTRLGRAYNLAAPASGRVLSGAVDASALHPPKQFFGAARNIEDGGSLTILATALVETGSQTDEIIFEEFTDTGNWQLRLSRTLADQRIFPAVDLVASSTSRDELLVAAEELAATTKLRRSLTAAKGQQSTEQVLERLAASADNAAFLRTV